MPGGYLLQSSQAALDAAARTEALAIEITQASDALRQATGLAPAYANATRLFREIWSGVRRALAVLSWNRKEDMYNAWQVWTFGHEAQVRLTAIEMARAIDSSIARVLPADLEPNGGCTVSFVQPDVMGAADNDAISVLLPLVLIKAGSRVELSVTLIGYVDFSEVPLGKFVLLAAPVVRSALPIDRVKIAKDIEARSHDIRIIDRRLYSQLGSLIPLSSQVNRYLSIFARLPKADRTFASWATVVPRLGEIPSNYTFAAVIPRQTYIVSLYEINGGSIFERGPVANPYGVGAERVEWFGVKSNSGPIDIDVDLGSFGRFRRRINPSYIFFHLCFEAAVSNGEAQLIAVTRLVSNGSIVAREVVRTIPNASAAIARLSNQGDLEFWVERQPA